MRYLILMGSLALLVLAACTQASPVITGLVAQLTGSLQTGLVVLCLLTGVGVVAGVMYPAHKTIPESLLEQGHRWRARTGMSFLCAPSP